MTALIDAGERARALTVNESFIVQAPAGSGKTELLIQRLLVLLASVQQPEEILAITFTRKAAAEMKNRLLESLVAAQGPEPDESHKKKTWHLAQAVMIRDRQYVWSLCENPTRLRVMTIDALSSQLAAQLPNTAFLGGGFAVTDNVNELYQQVALSVLLQRRPVVELKNAIERFLKHRHNDYQNAATLLASMLQSRHVWLPFFEVSDAKQARQFFEQALAKLIDQDLCALANLLNIEQFFSESALGVIAKISAYANEPLLNWQASPASHIDELKKWQAFCQFFLNQRGEFRQVFNKNQGIPALSSVRGKEKEQLQQFGYALKQLVNSLMAINIESQGQLLVLMQRVMKLPAPCYGDDDWQLLWSISLLLKELVAKLWLQFSHTRQLDFTQVALGALDALADQRGATDLALALDYKVSHILCDEFQDTSKVQLRLFELLSAGWQPDDGRTLFFVGDPMQSIYRFRHAEVEIFLDVRNKGLAGHILTPLVLKTNFRSQANIVNWVNRACQQFFPRSDNLATGAVCYSVSQASLAKKNGGVQIHLAQSDREETQQTVDLICQYLNSKKQGKIAVLVRSRSHLNEMMQALQKSTIAYQAVEIASLADCMVATDIVTLITVLNQPYHRLAWLAFLRASWCGLMLADLEIIANYQENLWQVVAGYQELNLSQDAKIRLARVVPIIKEAFFQRGRLSLRCWVQGVWEALGGSASLADYNDFNDAMSVFDLFDEESRRGQIDLEALKKRISLLKVSSQHSQARVQLMTIHKAKGLEFDCVILPRLHQGQGQSSQELLLWLSQGYGDPVLAPIPQKRQTHPLYDYIRSIEVDKNSHERMRLLYVALTRAKNELHLFAQVKFDKKNNIRLPVEGSFFKLLWPLAREIAETLKQKQAESDCDIDNINKNKKEVERKNYRLPLSWQLSADRYGLRANQYEHCLSQQERYEVHGFDNTMLLPEHFHWHAMDERAFGQVCHQLLCAISRVGICKWKKTVCDARVLTSLLRRYGLIGLKKDHALESIYKLIKCIEQSELAAYLLDPGRINARSEYVLLNKKYGRVNRHVIDRTFYDEQGIRWIIDFKTAQPPINSSVKQIDDFLKNEKKNYESQMKRYWQLFIDKGDKTVQSALYFPWLDQLVVYQQFI
ncbi:UvrD-helicase domain-containing protein [Piscirickettsia salmonis]|uniref:UvrD-helicase domain-containing protein n=1 Tax=Piscirickettsia salmonis TaxID=1238 RepID=UPI0037526A61